MFTHWSIATSKDKLYLFEMHGKIHEMTKPYEASNTLTTIYVSNFVVCFQRNTNKKGKIFLLNYNGPLFFFDPFGERRLTEVQDLQED